MDLVIRLVLFSIGTATAFCWAETTARPDGKVGKAPAQEAPSLQVLHGSTRAIRKVFKVKNAEAQVVEVKLEVDNGGGEPLNRDVGITVSIRCKGASPVRYVTVFSKDESCAFDELAYDSVKDSLVVIHEVARLVSESAPDRGRLRCEKKEPILIPLKCPPAKGS